MANRTTGKNSTKSTDHRGDNAANEPRDSEGRFAKVRRLSLPKGKLPKVKLPEIKRPDVKLPELTVRNAAIGALGAGAVVAAVAVGAALLRERKPGEADTSEAYVVDAAADSEGLAQDDRAPDAFRPDRNAPVPVPADKRAAFAPATKPVPSRVKAMGNGDD